MITLDIFSVCTFRTSDLFCLKPTVDETSDVVCNQIVHNYSELDSALQILVSRRTYYMRFTKLKEAESVEQNLEWYCSCGP